jgi:hopene-associated glycosyltransferase HpnB
LKIITFVYDRVCEATKGPKMQHFGAMRPLGRTMAEMLIAAGAFCLLIWLYLCLFHGRFWRIGTMMARPPRTEGSSAKVAVVIPARNEADVVGQCVASLLHQTGGHSIHVFLVDDSSSDETAEIARETARAAGAWERLTVSQGSSRPPGWSGKLWAVQQGVDQARELRPDFFLLTDADIVHAPDSVATLVASASDGSYDLASLMVKLHCSTFAERALIPAFVFFFFKLYPPAWISNPRRKVAGAAGGSILVRPAALERAGGIAAIRGAVIDDCALARKIKESGGRVWLGLATETRSIRPYGSFAEIGRMISRGAFNQLKHSPLMLLLALAGLTVTYLLPPALALFSRQWIPAILGAAAWTLMIVCFLPTLRLYRLSPLWALALPAIAFFYMGATIHSAVKFWMGRGGQWKGRIQDPAR